MKKIVHLITELESGGAEHMLAKLVSASDRRKCLHTVVSMTGEDVLGKKIRESGIPLWTLGMKRGRPSLLALFQFVRILRKENPDVLQTWLYHADLFGLLAGKLAGIRRIIWNVRCSDMNMEHYSRLSWWVVRILARLSSVPEMVIVNSEVGRDQHVRLGYSPKKWRVIYNGFDLEKFRPKSDSKPWLRSQLGVPPNSLLIGMIARFDPMKDHVGFIHAAGLVGRDYPEVHFVLVGKDVTPENSVMCQEISRSRLDGRVHLLGERHDISAIMAGIDLLCLSSIFGEGFSNVVGEAMASGVPCVVTDVGDSRFLVAETGKVVQPGDFESLAARMGELLSLDPSHRKKLGVAARARIQEFFSLPAIITQYEELYGKG